MSLDFCRLLLERYKAFEQPCEIEIRPLTILVGANNAGKSAVARAVPLLAGGFQQSDSTPNATPLPLQSFGLTHGASFEEVIAGRSVHGSIRLEADFRAFDQKARLAMVVQNVVKPGEKTQQIVTKWDLKLSGGDQIRISRPRLESDQHELSIVDKGTEATHPGTVLWTGLIPNLEELEIQAGQPVWLTEALTALPRWAQGVRYLRSPRFIAASPFRTPPTPPRSVGPSGHEAPLMLAASDDLLREVKAWFLETFDLKLIVRQERDSSLLEVMQMPGRTHVSIAQAGQGLSHVLPVVIQCITASEAGAGVDILEHPEAELHPRAHARIADLIVSRLPGPEHPVIVETHSEVLLLRVRRKVAEDVLKPEDVAIYWVDRDDQTGNATVQKVDIDSNGDVSNWPEGVFQEDYEEVVAIRREARRRSRQ
jgi:predicted ATPase